MPGKLLGAIVITLVLLRFVHELWRLIFDVDALKEDYRKRTEQLPAGSLSKRGQLYLINSRYGIWIQRLGTIFAIVVLAISIVAVLLH